MKLLAALAVLLPHEARALRVGSSPVSVRRCCEAQAAASEQPVRLWNSGVCPFAQVCHAKPRDIRCTYHAYAMYT